MRVLVVDDKEENIYYLATLLRGCGYEVDTARHGAEALTKARQLAPDVVISDLLMPVMDGYTLLRHWRADPRLAAIPFIVYTATYTEPEDEALALKLGADAFILKPAEPDAFLARLRQVEAEAAVATKRPPRPAPPASDDPKTLKEYSETLIRKLEEKTVQLEETNRSLHEDIAARERARADLREALAARDMAEREASARAAVLDAVFQSVPDVVTHVDLEGKIRLVNRAVPPLAREQLIGASWLSLVSPEQRETMKDAFAAVAAHGHPTAFESSEIGTNGVGITTHWTTISPVMREGKIIGVVVVTRDITERKQSEARLIVTDRMATVGTLAAGVAHEINNPLASVVANLALAGEEIEKVARLFPVSSDLRDEIHDARDGAERVRMIVRDLKIFSRSEEVKLGAVDVEQVLDSSLRLAWNEIRHRARLVKIFGQVPPVRANESRLGQVTLNLLINAAHAIPEGNYERNEIRIVTSEDVANGRVIVTVSDTGSGIPREVQGRLFTPFFTTKPVGVGTGLGLSICHRIVTDLGGTIDFSSEVGRGTTFRVCLPVAESDAPIEVPPATSDLAPRRRGRILVIDDDPPVATLIQRLLSAEHAVRSVHRATDALALVTLGERFDVILCDLMMPQVTGMDLYASLQALDACQAARVVFMTGGAFTATARAFLDATPCHRIEKPFEIQGLRALINTMLV
jgi:PAS domain S-box-containing protein